MIVKAYEPAQKEADKVNTCDVPGCDDPASTHRMCRRHYIHTLKGKKIGCRRCGATTPRHVRICTDCIREEFRYEHGFELLGIYVNTQTPVKVRCLTCDNPSSVLLNNLRRDHGCRFCHFKRNGDRCRLTPDEVEEILTYSGLRQVGEYVNANTPVECVCTRCGETRHPRLGTMSVKMQAGERVFGCHPCYSAKRSEELRVTVDEALDELLEANVEYVGGWVDGSKPFEGLCLLCSRPVYPTLKHIRSGHIACKSCGSSGFWSRARLVRRPELGSVPAYLYIFEFTDLDGTVFHKVGITRQQNKWSDRLDRHSRDGGKLLAKAEESLLVCYIAEQMIKQAVGPRSYLPHPDRLRWGGDSECYLPGDPIDLNDWLEKARAS